MKSIALKKNLLCCLVSWVCTASASAAIPFADMADAYLLSRWEALTANGASFGKGCAPILGGDFIYDQYQKLSSRYRVEQYYDWACRSDFRSKSEMLESSLNLGVPIKGLPAPLSLDGVFGSSEFSESLAQWCSSAWMNLSDQAAYEEFSRVVNQGMVSAYKACIDSERSVLLEKTGTFVYVTPQDEYLRKFLVVIEFRPPVLGQRTLVTSIEGSDIACTHDGKPFRTPYEVKNTTTLALTCIKYVDEARVVAVNAQPSGASTPVKFPGLSEGAILDLEQRTRGLAQSIIALRKESQTRMSRVGAATEAEEVKTDFVGGNRNRWTDQATCPEGYYVFGVVGQDQDGGGACYDCMSRFAVICRPVVSGR